jgi:ATP-dependent DNA ligase
VTDESGLAVFDLIRGHGKLASATLCAFDLIELDGTDYRLTPACVPRSALSKRLGSLYRSGRVKQWLKVKNPEAPAVRREAEEEWN